MKPHLRQVELTLSINGVTSPWTLDVTYIFVPHDDKSGFQTEILSIRSQSGIDISHALPDDIVAAILGEIDGQ